MLLLASAAILENAVDDKKHFYFDTVVLNT